MASNQKNRAYSDRPKNVAEIMNLALAHRKERWTLSLTGKLFVLLVAVSFAVVIGFEGYPFLSPNQPVKTDTLIVEGWIPRQVLIQAANEFKRGKYNRLIVLQCVCDENDERQTSENHDSVSQRLVRLGVPSESVAMLYHPAVERDRTYHAALATKTWSDENGMTLKSFNVATIGPHARRSWLMFGRAFGATANVGIVALVDPTYDGRHWWRTSEGVREVLGEAIAYIYARFFFWP